MLVRYGAVLVCVRAVWGSAARRSLVEGRGRQQPRTLDLIMPLRIVLSELRQHPTQLLVGAEQTSLRLVVHERHESLQ